MEFHGGPSSFPGGNDGLFHKRLGRPEVASILNQNAKN